MKKKNNKVQPTNKKIQEANESLKLITGLDLLRSKRNGGAQNIQGISFQLIYSCYLILTKLEGNLKEIYLEGLEDIDYIAHAETPEYIQLKSSKNDLNAGVLWERQVLQNFMEVYRVNPNSKFKLVHNTTIPEKGKLKELTEGKPSESTLNFWKEKFEEAQIDISTVDLINFFKSVCFEKVDEISLQKKCISELIKRYDLNSGTEIQYFNALFHKVFEWSKTRSKINSSDIDKLIISVRESFSKHPVNLALQNNWIIPVSFEFDTSKDHSDYFDGKAARPIHISNNLPVQRPLWENQVESSINTSDITLIKASSGQGKSTLTWLVSKTLLGKGYSILHLKDCQEQDHVTHLFDFIELRIKTGQIPLIVIDGLNQNVQSWGILAERLQELPVKFLISSREEDWVKYGHDLSRIQLKPIDISLSIQEAQEIYNQLKIKGKIHPDISRWQPAWERIQEKGLLIEYVYLLTQGQMIAERLQTQVKTLNTEKSAAAKIEILRLISLADTMGIKLQTSRITQHIFSTVRFESDRNETYKQLEKEYYVNFDNQYVEGLHPVRSKHLVEILHSSISLSETLVSLVVIIDEAYIYDIFSSIPHLLKAGEKNNVYSKISDVFSKKKFSEIVFAIDGLMQAEAKKYWEINKEIFDEVSSSAQLDFFVYDTLPYTKLDMVNKFRKPLQEQNGQFDYLAEKLKELTPFSVSDSDITLFMTQIKGKIKLAENPGQQEGLNFLVKWFNRLDIALPEVNIPDEFSLLNCLKSGNINEASELFSYYHSVNPTAYNAFIEKNKSEVFSWLKKKTDSISLYEIDNDIHINYLLDDSKRGANEYSVYRINTIHAFLPNYDTYNTKAIILPFPNEDIYKIVIQDSTKAMPKENITNLFDVHINQIWSDAILSNYRTGSMYEWQKQYNDIREKGLEFVKKCVRVFESHIEANPSRIRTSAQEWLKPAQELLVLLNSTKKAAKQNGRYYEKGKYEPEQKEIQSWCSSLRNFVNQMSNIIVPKGTNDQNLATRNLTSAVFRLPLMQKSLVDVAKDSYDYFPSNKLSIHEAEWYDRLLRTARCYVHRKKTSDTKAVFVVKKFVEEWFEKDKSNRLENLHLILKDFEKNSYLNIHLPNSITQIDNLSYAVIGVEGIDINAEEHRDFEELLFGLVDLDKTDIDFFTFIHVLNGEALNGFRVGNTYFRRLRTLITTGNWDEGVFGNPIPIIPNEEMISPLPQLKLKKVIPNINDEGYIKMMFEVWKLSEHRDRLNINSKVERDWLLEIEEKSKVEISRNFPNLHEEDVIYIQGFLNGERTMSIEGIVYALNKRLQDINEKIYNE